jgi:hypothetical protein
MIFSPSFSISSRASGDSLAKEDVVAITVFEMLNFITFLENLYKILE